LARLFTFILLMALAGDAFAITVSQSRLASSVDEHYCKVPIEVSVIQPTQRQVFLWFVARGVKPGDALEVDWLDPSGAVSNQARYDDLPAASEICITTQLPVAGFAPASQPGAWTVRVKAGERELVSKRFQIVGDAYAGGPRVTSVAWSRSGAAESDFTVRGEGFQPGSIVHIAEYTRTGGWRYLASLQPRSLSASELTAHYSGLPAAEYLAIVEGPDLRMSRPVPFLISTSGYKLPFAAREPWVLTQGPYGTFSHWGNSLHAFDIAPVTGRCVVAMRAGIAYTHDNHLHQDHVHRTFGNYITVDHGDGEFSHYAHLATGTFLVANGQHVEQGQALATAGNSGYTLGEGGGYHVHVHITRALPIASQSIPFQFEDLPGGSRGGMPRTIVSTNDSPLCDCRKAQPGMAGAGAQIASNTNQRATPPQFTGSLSVEQWWSEVVTVPKRSKSFDVTLTWKPVDADLDLHVVSPSGAHYSWYGDTTGYSGMKANPQEFRLPRPEPGYWRVSVQAVKGGPAPIEFGVSTSGQKSRTSTPAVGGSR
jgi:hypothetical protein